MGDAVTVETRADGSVVLSPAAGAFTTSVRTANDSRRTTTALAPPTRGPVARKLTGSPSPGERAFFTAAPGDRPDGDRFAWQFGNRTAGLSEPTAGRTAAWSFSGAGAHLAVLRTTTATGVTRFDLAPVTVGNASGPPVVREIRPAVDGYVLADVPFENEYTVSVVEPDAVERVEFRLDGESYTATAGPPWRVALPVGELSESAWLNVTVVGTDGGRTTAARRVPVTDPPGYVSAFLSAPGGAVGSDGTLRADYRIPPTGRLGFQREIPQSAPALAGKEIGVSLMFRGGTEYRMPERRAESFGTFGGGVSIPVPTSVPLGEVSVSQNTAGGLNATYVAPSWELTSGGGWLRVSQSVEFTVGRNYSVGLGGMDAEAKLLGLVGVGTTGGMRLDLATRDGTTDREEVRIDPAPEEPGYIGATGRFRAEGEATGSVSGGLTVPTPFGERTVGDVTGRIVGDVSTSVSVPDTEEYGAAANVSIIAEGTALGYSKRFTIPLGSGTIGNGAPPLADGLPSGPVASREVVRPATNTPVSAPIVTGGARAGPKGVFGSLPRPNAVLTGGRLTTNEVTDRQPAVTVRDGVYTVVWSRGTAGVDDRRGRELYWGTYTPDGGWQPAGPITDDRLYDATPDVAVAPDGTRVAVWQRVDHEGVDSLAEALGRTEIVYAVADGDDWSTPRVLAEGPALHDDPRVVHADGRFVAAWAAAPLDADAADPTPRVATATVDPDSGPTDRRVVRGAVRPDLSTAAGRPTLAYVEAGAADGANASVVAVERLSPDGATTAFTTTVRGFVDYDLDGERLAVANRSGRRIDIRLTNGTAASRVPVAGTSVAGQVELTRHAGDALVTFSGQNGSAPRPRLYYQLRHDGRWQPTRRYGAGLRTDRILHSPGVAGTDRGLLSVVTGTEGRTNAPDELYAALDDYRADLELRVSAESRRAARRNATVGDQVTLEYVVENTGDTAVPREFAVTGPGAVDRQAPLATGANRTGSLTVRVPDSGVVRLVADGERSVTELTEENNAARVVVARPDVTVGVERRRANGSVGVTVSLANEGVVPVENGSLVLSVPTRNETRRAGNISIAAGEASQRTVELPGDLQPSSSLVVELRTDRAGREVRTTRRVVPAVTPDLSVDADGVWFHRADGQAYATVYVENTGSARSNATLRVGSGSDAVTRPLCLAPPADGSRATSAVVRVPVESLDAGATVPVVASDPFDLDPGDDGALPTVALDGDAARPPVDRSALDCPTRDGGTADGGPGGDPDNSGDDGADTTDGTADGESGSSSDTDATGDAGDADGADADANQNIGGEDGSGGGSLADAVPDTGLPLTLLGAGLAVVVLLGAGVLYWRR
jgi:hypothetical protein